MKEYEDEGTAKDRHTDHVRTRDITDGRRNKCIRLIAND